MGRPAQVPVGDPFLVVEVHQRLEDLSREIGRAGVCGWEEGERGKEVNLSHRLILTTHGNEKQGCTKNWSKLEMTSEKLHGKPFRNAVLLHELLKIQESLCTLRDPQEPLCLPVFEFLAFCANRSQATTSKKNVR